MTETHQWSSNAGNQFTLGVDLRGVLKFRMAYVGMKLQMVLLQMVLLTDIEQLGITEIRFISPKPQYE